MTDKSANIRWGILATGRIAHQFAGDFKAVSNGVVQAVGSRSLKNATLFAERHNIPNAHESYESLFNDPEVDVIYIATPHAMHLENIRSAISAGKAVLCEKPLVLDSMECRDAMSTATGHYLMEAMWTYFLPPVVRAREWVESGRIGKLRQIKADFGYPIGYNPKQREWDAELGGGCLLEMGIYPVALLWYFLGKPAETIQVSGNRAENGVESELSALLAYDDCIATIGTSFLSKLRNWAYIIGEDGYIAIPDFWRASACYLYQLDQRVDAFIDERETAGLNYEAESVGRDILKGKSSSDVMPLPTSLALQEEMERINALISH